MGEKSNAFFFDSRFSRDLNQELETMKQLLKEIVKRITDNLLGKSMNSSETGRQSRLTQEESQSVRRGNIHLVFHGYRSI